MPAPDTIALSGGGGPWPAFALSGAIGPDALDINDTYFYHPAEVSAPRRFISDSGLWLAAELQSGVWDLIANVPFAGVQFVGLGAWPWTASWTPDGGHTGTLAFAKVLAPPQTLDLGEENSGAAALTTNLTGANNDLLLTSKLPGRLGNAVRIRYLNPSANNAALAVTVAGREISVSLATGGGGAISSTAAQVKTAIDSHPAASALITVANAAVNNGSGTVTELAWTYLSGGGGGLPLPPDTIDL